MIDEHSLTMRVAEQLRYLRVEQSMPRNRPHSELASAVHRMVAAANAWFQIYANERPTR